MPETLRTRKTRIKKKILRLLLSQDFYSDLEIDGMLYAALLRSPSGSGTITSISYPNIPEGYFFFTAADIPENDVVSMLDTPISIFCSGNVSYQGEPIGMLVGPDQKKVNELLSKFEILYDTETVNSALETIISENTKTDADQGKDIPLLPPTAAQTAASRIVRTGKALNGNKSDFQQLFKDAACTVENTWSYVIQHQSYEETNGAICLFDDGILTVFTPTQWLPHLRKTLSSVLSIDMNHIVVKKTKISNRNTTGIWGNAILACQAGIAAVKTGKPVKICLTREEQKKYIEKPVPVTITCKTAATAEGRIVAQQTRIIIAAGAYNPFAGEILDRLVIASCGIYNIPNIEIIGKAYVSSTAPSSVTMNTIEAQAYFALESQIQAVADRTGLSPVELREINGFSNSSFVNSMPFFFNALKLKETLEGLTSISDFRRKYTSYRIDRHTDLINFTGNPSASPVRGIGLACTLSGSGYFGSHVYDTGQKMEVTMEKDGTLTIHSLPPSSSVLNIWKSIAAGILDIPAESVKLNSKFDANQEPQLPEDIYNNLSIMTQLIKKCCRSIQRKRFRSPLPITVKKGITSAQKKKWDQESFSGEPFYTTAGAAAAVEVEFDAAVYTVTIRGIWITIDCGEILSVAAAKQTIRKNIQQVLSELISDTILSCDNINISFLQSTADPRQIDGLVYNIIPAAFAAAVSQACSVTVNSLPIKTDSLYNMERIKLNATESEKEKK
ncbi:MAG: xanthine dehydrogenase family protein molybdopterin-binding subunit [Treponema sp.]|jgi:CO/xanthine dehydrogenase Mo-binding subunit|nr:xanthine dehydrogenase family protein molybdopterin-binding subunit [Treponema sp.]